MLRLLALALALAAPGPALAWQQATTGTGLPLYQEGECLWWSLARRGSDDIADTDALRQAVARGFDAWNDVECASVHVADAGLSSCTQPDIAPSGTQVTLVVFYEDSWPFDSPLGNPFAATGLWYDPDTGQILDADIAMNGLQYTWSLDGAEGTVDVQSIVAHESGHVLGLGESSVTEATMYGFAVTGETSKRDLADDDVEGICTLYPVGEAERPCPGPPSAAAMCRDRGCGCGVGGRADPTRPVAALFVLALLAHLAVANRPRGRGRRR